ncbi:MAG: MotA/TolQ/ExbB proton channel family protein [Rhodospirillales bacterium]|nr:MotA/TolQ/ExbB proton channel family protein [Rhodospirillales bacterium]
MQEIIHAVKVSGGLMIVMAVVLLIALIVIIERLYVLKKVLAQGKDIHNKLRQVPYQDIAGLQGLASTKEDTLQGHLISTAVASRGETSEEMELHLEEEIMAASPKISRGLWVLDTTVTIAPLLGLFGTIIGMIEAFSVITGPGSTAQVTGGISDALYSTGSGLFVAIIAVYFVNYFSNLTRDIFHQLELIKLVLINRVHGKGVGVTEVAPRTLRAGMGG